MPNPKTLALLLGDAFSMRHPLMGATTVKVSITVNSCCPSQTPQLGADASKVPGVG